MHLRICVTCGRIGCCDSSPNRHATAHWHDEPDHPLVRSFEPGLLIVSAGFDAHAADPLAQLNWDDEDFAAITRMICDMAADLSAPVVSCLEGGYDLDALGRSARAHVQVLLEARE